MSSSTDGLVRSTLSWCGATGAVLALFAPAIALAQPPDAEQCVVSTIFPGSDSTADDALHALPHAPTPPHTAFHGQLLLGRESTYLYHLPLFMGNPRSHPHNFQVVLEVELADDTAQSTYREDRGQHPDQVYSATPQNFDQSALVLDYPGHPPLRSLPVEVFRGHFERPPNERILGPTPLGIGEVVHFREFLPGGQRLEPLSYVLFGRGGETFAAHLLSAPPDFDQVLTVQTEGLPADQVRHGLYISLPKRTNDVSDRLRPGQEIACRFDGGEAAAEVTLRVVREPYCEVGEVGQVGFAPSRNCPGD